MLRTFSAHTRFFSVALSLAFFSVFNAPTAQAQEAELLQTMSLGDIIGLGSSYGIPTGILNPTFAVNAYRVSYEMPFLDSVVTVSGALFVPQSMNLACGAPTLTYMHGTVFLREDAPSFLGSEGQLGFLMASKGFVTLMPDYVGLGLSELLHPYIHAQSEADAGIYLLSAAETLSAELGYTMGDQNFVIGYSQGGHASMAMAREMQEVWSDTFPLTAAAPMSGPYDLSGTQFALGIEQDEYSNPSYFAYMAMAWQSIYGDLFSDLSDWIVEPYASELPGMFDGLTSSGEINDYLPSLTADLLQPGVLEQIMEPGSTFMAAAQDNDVYEWVPESPVQMYYCTEDEQVFYENALVAEAYMNDQGAATVTSSNGGALTHGGCALIAILGGTLWCSGQASFCEVVGVDENWNPEDGLSVFPNPATDLVRIEGMVAGTAWQLTDAAGRIVERGVSDGSSFELNTAAFARGLYILKGGSAQAVRIALH
jgi:pimeloyl-ACP methyl ester carboxylesterase